MKDYNHKHLNKECYVPSGKEGAFSSYTYTQSRGKSSLGAVDKWTTNLQGTEGVFFELERKFNELAIKWKKETGGYSTTLHKAGNDNYLEIIGLGKDVVPYILRSLLQQPDHWFVALKAITSENPVPKEHIGNIQKMTEDWLDWGRKRSLI